MLCGEAVVAIWNGITEAGREQFYDWHLHEHMPERVGIPGFRRGRRYIAADDRTAPEFFTLYETDTMQVLQGSDYLARLNAPTPWTMASTAHFKATSRGLARVVASAGVGMGGVMLTVRFAAGEADREAAIAAVRGCAAAPRITGAHLAIVDGAASGVVTEEKRGRTDVEPPPSWIALVEATDAAALDAVLGDGVFASGRRGVYRLEHVRMKTGWG